MNLQFFFFPLFFFLRVYLCTTIPNPPITNNNSGLLPAVASTKLKQETSISTQYKKIVIQLPRAKKTQTKDLDPCWPYEDQGKTSVDKTQWDKKDHRGKKPQDERYKMKYQFS